MKKLTKGEIYPGMTLPWAVYNGSGQLLLREGYVIQSLQQAERLVHTGIFRRTTEKRRRNQTKSEMIQHKVSVYQEIADLREILRSIYKQLLSASVEESQVKQRIENLADSLLLHFRDTYSALAAAQLYLCVDYRYDHPLHASFLVAVLGKKAGLPVSEIHSLVCAALTHDIGLARVQSELDGQTGELSKSQLKKVLDHPERGEQILRDNGIDDPLWLDSVLNHHERLDGSGYPNGLKGDDYPLHARILGIADIYTAMIRPRVYRKAISSNETLRTLFVERGKSIDEKLTKLLVSLLGLYPPGTLVRLDDGQIGVAARPGDTLKETVVFSVMNADGTLKARPREVENPVITGVEDPHNYKDTWFLIESCFQ